jgi:transposase
MKSEQRNKIIEVYEKRLNPSEDRSIRKFELYVSNTDYVIVYEYIFKSESCPSKTFKYIKAFKASSKEKAYKALQKRIAESFTYDRYISHKILLETQPFADSATLLNKAAQLLREYQQDSIKEARRAAAMGGRG